MANPISSKKLHKFGSSDKTEFMRKVYAIHVKASDKKRDFVGDLPGKDIADIECGIKARKDAALLCQQLLIAAREELQKQKQAKAGAALRVKGIGIASGYRSANRQFSIWRQYFPKYYRLTEEKRKKLPGGEHAEAAARLLKSFIAKRLAAPGFSLHNSGIAIDFKTTDQGHHLGPSKSQTQLWKKSWFFHWLMSNAMNFGFYQNTHIDEPWHWELKATLQVVDFTRDDEDEISLKCVMEEGDDYPV